MPKPRELGNVSRHVLEGIEDELILTQRQMLAGALIAQSGDKALITEAFVRGAEPVNTALLAVSNLLANDQKKAERIIREAQQARKKQK